MNEYFNPFEYEQANKLSNENLLNYYIQDYNYSRFILSKRNIILAGERGAGKTMTLLYNSFPVQVVKNKQKNNEINFDIINIYVPCNTQLTHKKEYLLFNKFQASIISEHFFVISILYSIARTLYEIPDIIADNEQNELRNDYEYILGFDLPIKQNIFESLMLFLNKELANTQTILNSQDIDAFCERSISFSSGVMPFIACLKNYSSFKNSHFSFLIDDAQCLNLHQTEALNSWVSYRDNSTISFKIATTKVDQPPLTTTSGGCILEGHDYTFIDMELPYRNQFSDFGKMAKEIISTRLKMIGSDKTPDEFFPENSNYVKELNKYKEKCRQEAEKIYGENETKKINDYVYKYHRVEYFRSRSHKANRPPYSGFETIVHLSSGVIRNLLDPCFKMYDKVYSDLKLSQLESSNKDVVIKYIPPSIQNDIISQRSKEKWEELKKIDNGLVKCSSKQGEYINNLFRNLAGLFKERLMKHKSEPRAISFTISEKGSEYYKDIMDLINISRKYQMLYTYTSSAKSHGEREEYYVPNRMLWPDIGLDPVGQHARVSIKSSLLYKAAKDNIKIPFENDEETNENHLKQLGLFDE